MKRLLSSVGVLSLTVLTGCAGASETSGRGSGTPVTTRIVTQSANFNLDMVPEDNIPVHWVRAPLETVWNALPAVYNELGIDVQTMDTERWEIGNRNIRGSRRLGKERLSTYLDCGVNPIGAAAADVYAVQLSLTTQLQEDEAGTTMRTLVHAAAKPRGGGATESRCSTTGVLEERIAEMVGRGIPN